MSTTRGIFENFPNQPQAVKDSPFAIVNEPAEAAVASSPFTAVNRQDSPFMVVDEVNESRQVESGRPAVLPERRKIDSPFQVAEPSEGFGFEAPAKNLAASPFDSPPAAAPVVPSPFSVAPSQAAASPFSAAPPQAATSPFSAAPQQTVVSPSTQAAIAAFGNWQETPPAPAVTPAPAAEIAAPAVTPVFAQPTPSAFAPVAQAAPAAPQATTQPFSQPAQAASEFSSDSQSDSFSIKQLELRAIFGVDREMNTDEILQRSRSLPGMRNIARVNPQDMGTIEGLKNLLPNLGFGSGGLKLYAGSVPLEFIREGPVLLAVQTDGGFAPGVRETLMLVARELGRLS